jgi:hypothetical protein
VLSVLHAAHLLQLQQRCHSLGDGFGGEYTNLYHFNIIQLRCDMLFDICILIYQSTRCFVAEDRDFNIAQRISFLICVIRIIATNNNGKYGSVMRIVFIHMLPESRLCKFVLNIFQLRSLATFLIAWLQLGPCVSTTHPLIPCCIVSNYCCYMQSGDYTVQNCEVKW